MHTRPPSARRSRGSSADSISAESRSVRASSCTSGELPTFVDTNVLVYAHDRRAHVHERARLLVAELWREREGILSTQVLQELYVALTRKVQKPLRRTLAREVIR
ncbi:MAG: PIN domain-containing protein, partial [Actinobacteria bacterium]|nr:PIN domain-containing protein [Actinomycetota bacterium]